MVLWNYCTWTCPWSRSFLKVPSHEGTFPLAVITLSLEVNPWYVSTIYTIPAIFQVLLMTLQNAPPGLDYERDKKFSRVYILDHLYILPMLSTTYVWIKNLIIELQANDCYVFGKRPFKEAFGKEVVEATFFQASSFHWFHCSKAFGRIAWPWCQISSFEGILV